MKVELVLLYPYSFAFRLMVLHTDMLGMVRMSIALWS